MSDFEKFRKIVKGSKEYSFSGTVLTLKGYYTGETVKLDLGLIDEKMLKEIIIKNEDEDDEEECD